MSTWLAVVVVGFGSYLFRAAPLLLGGAALPPIVQRAVRHAGTGALTALIMLGVAHLGPSWPAAAVGVTVAALVAARGGKMLPMMAAGLAVFWAAGVLL